jgi:hypothetical protein
MYVNGLTLYWYPAGGSASTGLFLHWVGWQERQEAVFRGLEPYIGNSLTYPWDHARWDLFKKLVVVWKNRSNSTSIKPANPRDKPERNPRDS